MSILQGNSGGQNVITDLEQILIVVRYMVTIVYKGWIDPLKQEMPYRLPSAFMSSHPKEPCRRLY